MRRAIVGVLLSLALLSSAVLAGDELRFYLRSDPKTLQSGAGRRRRFGDA